MIFNNWPSLVRYFKLANFKSVNFTPAYYNYSMQRTVRVLKTAFSHSLKMNGKNAAAKPAT